MQWLPKVPGALFAIAIWGLVVGSADGCQQPNAEAVVEAYDQLVELAEHSGRIAAVRDYIDDLAIEHSAAHPIERWLAGQIARDDAMLAELIDELGFLEMIGEHPGAGGLAATILDQSSDPELKSALLAELHLLTERGRFPEAYYASLARRHDETLTARTTPEPIVAMAAPTAVPATIADQYGVFAPVAAEIGRRRGRDQLIRWLLIDEMTHEVRPEHREEFLSAIEPFIGRIDNDNTRYVLQLFSHMGFLQLFHNAPSVAELGIAIVHHGNNVDARRELLAIIEPLALQGRFSGQRYALFHDRLAEIEGRPQRFGTQDMCVDGVRVPYTLEEPEQEVDARRAEVGLGPIEPYFDNIRSQYGSC